MTDRKQGSLIFVDSNIWIYAVTTDAKETSKHDIAEPLVERLIKQSQIVASTQVINEVCFNLIRKSAYTEVGIQELIESFYRNCTVIVLERTILEQGSNLRSRYNFSFWDGLIVASALSAGAETLYSEDMQDGLVVDSCLEIVNPFE